MTDAYGLNDFVDEVRSSITNQQSPAAVLEALKPGFGRLLANPTFLRKKIEEIGSWDNVSERLIDFFNKKLKLK